MVDSPDKDCMKTLDQKKKMWKQDTIFAKKSTEKNHPT